MHMSHRQYCISIEVIFDLMTSDDTRPWCQCHPSLLLMMPHTLPGNDSLFINSNEHSTFLSLLRPAPGPPDSPVLHYFA